MFKKGDDYRAAVRRLESAGFIKERSTGSHAVYRNGDRSVTVVVNHMKKRIPENTVNFMNRQASGSAPFSWGGEPRERP